jgi:hypothetical protein
MDSASAALVVGLTSSAVAVVAVVANVFQTRATLGEQRLQMQDERIWNRRADVYVRTLTLVEFDRSELARDEFVRELSGCRSELLAWGSAPVVSLADELLGLARNTGDEAAIAERGHALAAACRAELLGALAARD